MIKIFPKDFDFIKTPDSDFIKIKKGAKNKLESVTINKRKRGLGYHIAIHVNKGCIKCDKRYWTRSAAQLDAERVAVDILSIQHTEE